jgi:TetR/AcrR family acrAB operon transcriptional repressor
MYVYYIQTLMYVNRIIESKFKFMVRKTKEDAELTRQRIIDAAREVFLMKGVSRTSIEQVAKQAGVTRGAVYWHFNDKSDLFHAMREQVLLPLIDRMDVTLLDEGSDDPLTRIEQFLCGTIQTLDESLETRQTYEIMMIKCEYVDEFLPVLQQILSTCSGIKEKIRATYEHAQAKGLLRESQSPAALAMDTHIFFSGLLHMWVKDLDGTQFRQQSIELIKSHIDLRRK